MSDQKQEQQKTGIRGTSAKTIVVKVNPLALGDDHGFSRLVKQPLSKINLLEELKDNDVVNNINKLKQLQSLMLITASCCSCEIPSYINKSAFPSIKNLDRCIIRLR